METGRSITEQCIVVCLSVNFDPLDNASLGQCVPWTMRPLDDASSKGRGKRRPRVALSKVGNIVRGNIVQGHMSSWRVAKFGERNTTLVQCTVGGFPIC